MMISLRAVTTGDEEFLFSVYSSTRAEDMEMVDWDFSQKESFLRTQFNAQAQYYWENYPGASFQIILWENHSIGRLYIHRRNDEIRVIDIALLPEFRRQGIGSFLMNRILDDAARSNLPVTLHVEWYNPALHLYERLGFHLEEDKGVYLVMKWLPAMVEKKFEPLNGNDFVPYQHWSQESHSSSIRGL